MSEPSIKQYVQTCKIQPFDIQMHIMCIHVLMYYLLYINPIHLDVFYANPCSLISKETICKWKWSTFTIISE